MAQNGTNAAFQIRALSSDNACDVTRVIELFRAHYAERYPLKAVYSQKFWESEEDADFLNELTSVVILLEGEIVAHWAIRRSPAKRALEVLHPAMHPAFRDQVFQLNQMFWDHINQMAARQKLRVMYLPTFQKRPTKKPNLHSLENECIRDYVCSSRTQFIPRMKSNGANFSRLN